MSDTSEQIEVLLRLLGNHNRDVVNISTLHKLEAELKDLTLPESIEASKVKCLEKFELIKQANDYVEELVVLHREKLYILAKTIAKEESEEDVITKAHVKKAINTVYVKRAKWDFSDAYLGLGGLFLGAGFPHLLDLFGTPQPPARPILLTIGVIGAILFGMGILDKGKK